MNDHAQRIHAQQQRDAENTEMEQMAERSAPLLWSVYLAVAIAAIGMAADHIERYLDLAADNEAMVQCLMGRTIGLDNSLVRCNVRELVAEVQP